MSKTSISVRDRVAKLYAKNPGMTKILASSTATVRTYTEKDGIPLLDSHLIRRLTGLPCLPYNKIIQVAGKPDTGKSTVAMETIVAAQAAGFDVILWDAEDKADPTRLEKMGGQPDKLYVIKTNEIRKGGQLVKDYTVAIKEDNSEAKILIVWDSVGASVSRSETERNLADDKHGQPGQEAKENGSVARHIVGLFNTYPDSLCCLLINQTYAKIGFMQRGDKAKGGSGIEYLSSWIIGLNRIKVLTKIKDRCKVKTGIITRATVTKNHLTQNDTSVYQMDFLIGASGIQNMTEATNYDDENDGDEEET